jgi:PPE-repeat protein
MYWNTITNTHNELAYQKWWEAATAASCLYPKSEVPVEELEM